MSAVQPTVSSLCPLLPGPICSRDKHSLLGNNAIVCDTVNVIVSRKRAAAAGVSLYCGIGARNRLCSYAYSVVALCSCRSRRYAPCCQARPETQID